MPTATLLFWGKVPLHGQVSFVVWICCLNCSPEINHDIPIDTASATVQRHESSLEQIERGTRKPN